MQKEEIIPELSLDALINIMFMGTFDGSIPAYRKRQRKEGVSDEKDKEMKLLELESAIHIARSYKGSYSQEEMRLALHDLIEGNRLDCRVLHHHVKYACVRGAKPVVIEMEGEKKNVYMNWREVNGILRALERFGMVTRDFLQGTIYWVCQEQPNGSYYSCLLMPHSVAPRQKQIYFCDESLARQYMEVFSSDMYCSEGNPVYLLKVIDEGKYLRTEELCCIVS